MMMTSQEKADDKQNLLMAAVPPSGDTQPSAPHMTLPWTANLVPAGSHGYPVSSLWRGSSAPLQEVTPNVAALHHSFLKAKPLPLGIVQIITALSQVGLAISLTFFRTSWSVNTGVQFWGPLVYIFAGSFSILAYKKPTLLKVRMSLIFNIFSAFASFAAIIVNIMDISYLECVYGECVDHTKEYVIITSLIFLNLLVFCVSSSLSAFGCNVVAAQPSKEYPVLVTRSNVTLWLTPPSSSTSELTSLNHPSSSREKNTKQLDKKITQPSSF